MNPILQTILDTTYNENQLKHRLRILKSYLLNAFFGGQNNHFDPHDLEWLSLLPKSFFQNFTKENVYEKFEELEEESAKLPILTIYLPIEGTDNIALQIGSYARRTFQNPSLLLDTKFDPTLIAGAALSWKGIYKDYSIRSKMESKKEELLQNFKKFLK